MNHLPETQIVPVYRPSTRQVERGARMRRFNIFAIYMPIGLALIRLPLPLQPVENLKSRVFEGWSYLESGLSVFEQLWG